jgi:hypothetical protein
VVHGIGGLRRGEAVSEVLAEHPAQRQCQRQRKRDGHGEDTYQ